MKFTNNKPPVPDETPFAPIDNSFNYPCDAIFQLSQEVCGHRTTRLAHMVRKMKDVIVDTAGVLRNAYDIGFKDDAYLVVSVLVCEKCGAIRSFIPGSEKPILPFETITKNDHLNDPVQ